MSEDIQKLKREIRERDRRIHELEKIVSQDPMTGALNRKGFLNLAERLTADIKGAMQSRGAKREHYHIDFLTVLFFDIDNFKSINDAFGHEMGDKIIKYVISIIEEKIRTSDFVARFGGEEIVVGLVGADIHDSAQKADEIRKAIKSRVAIPQDTDRKVTVSVGVAEYDGKESVTDLIKRADQAMYKAKTTGKDKVALAQ